MTRGKSSLMDQCRRIIVIYFSKTASPNRNTLDSFVIKREIGQSFEEPSSRSESKKTPSKTPGKRTQSSIEDYMFKDVTSSSKRLKK